MLDADLARIYGVTTKQLNQQLKRNTSRFPTDFAFQLTAEEYVAIRSQNVTTSRRPLSSVPWVFTEHGAIMLASVLSSPVAVEASIRVVRAFVHLRQALASARRQHTKVAVMFIDLDRFKAINVDFGHQAGEHVLKETATRLMRCVRGVDTVSRHGGEEFVVVLADIGGVD